MPTQRRVALVTGSATGVGRACAIRFAQLGFDVVVNYSRSEAEARETVALVEAAGAEAMLVKCDISDDAAVTAMLAQIETTFGRLDVLVNNAACTFPVEHKNLDAMTEDKWDRILAVNVKGTFFVTRAATPLLRKSDQAAVVTVSSVAGLVGLGSSIAYCASKGAVNTMTKSLARVLAPIRVNAVCPGPIETRWLHSFLSDEQIAGMVAKYPIPRVATPDDITDAIYFLACGTQLTTGQCLTVDGGQTL